jgi:hypothetical protein
MNNLTQRQRVVQDNNTERVVEFLFKRTINLITLSEPTEINSYTLKVEAGHNLVVNNYVALIEDGVPFQAKVLGVNTNTITLDSPFDRVYSVSTVGARTTIDMNVNGSTTPVIFNINPIQRAKWHINGVVIQITSTSAMDDSKFGGITALSKGLLLRHKNRHFYNISNVKSNGDFILRNYSVQYSDKAPAGVFGLKAEKVFNGHNGNGSAICLRGDTLNELQIIVQDNLTGLSRIQAMAFGRIIA